MNVTLPLYDPVDDIATIALHESTGAPLKGMQAIFRLMNAEKQGPLHIKQVVDEAIKFDEVISIMVHSSIP